MKIVDVSEFYAPAGGGVRTYVEAKFIAAKRAGHELVVVAPAAQDGVEARPGGRVRYVKSPAIPVDRRYHIFMKPEGVHRVLDEEVPDLIEASSPWRGASIVSSWPGSAPRALFMHIDPVAVYPQQWFRGALGPQMVDRLFAWFWAYLRRLAAGFDELVTNSAWLARRLTGQGLIAPHAVPMGVDKTVFTTGLGDEALRRELLARCGLGPKGTLLLGVGRHHPEKRWPMLIDAVRRLEGEARVGFALAGDGMSRAAVDRAAARAKHVAVLGAVEDRALLARMMGSADALLHGSQSETFGLAVAEALACGAPLIVPSAGNCGDLAAPGHAVSYARPDATGAVRAIREFLGRDLPAMRAAANAAGATLIQSADDHFVRLFALYEELAGGGGHRRLPLAA